MSSPQSLSPRERILAVAGPLFFREGFRGVGVDRVIAESGVAKATFYRHFPSKDDLIVAWLQQADSFMNAWLEKSVAGSKQPLVSLFLALEDLAAKPECLGCTFQGVSAEFPDFDHPGHRTAVASKQRVLARIEDLAVETGVARPRVLAEQLYLLLEGAWASVRMFGREAPVGHAAAAARALVAAAG